MTRNPVVVFLVSLTLVCYLSYFLHQYILSLNNYSAQSFLLVKAYVANYLMAAFIALFLYFIRKKFVSILGFLFMAGSFIKFGVFLAMFYPSYNADGDVTKPEFASFFIPYAVCLTAEVVFLVRILNRFKSE